MMGKGVCLLSILNMYWIQFVALQSFASLPHSNDKTFALVDGACTSLQALYIAEKRFSLIINQYHFYCQLESAWVFFLFDWKKKDRLVTVS